MKYMLDANTCILLLAGHPNVVARASECYEGDIVVSAIAFAEIALGSVRGKPPSPILLDPFLRQFPLLPFDKAAAQRYADLPFRRGSFDRLIAAHAIALNVAIVTDNERDFADIPDLEVENWT